MTPSPQRWTQTHLTDLRRRAGAGETVETIAAGFDRSIDDVRSMAARLRLRVAPSIEG